MITSPDNQKLKEIRKLAGRKWRDKLRQFVAEGEDLLAAVFPDQAACAENLTGEICIPDHPLVKETIDNCLREAMDIDGLLRVLVEREGVNG